MPTLTKLHVPVIRGAGGKRGLEVAVRLGRPFRSARCGWMTISVRPSAQTTVARRCVARVFGSEEIQRVVLQERQPSSATAGAPRMLWSWPEGSEWSTRMRSSRQRRRRQRKRIFVDDADHERFLQHVHSIRRFARLAARDAASASGSMPLMRSSCCQIMISGLSSSQRAWRP